MIRFKIFIYVFALLPCWWVMTVSGNANTDGSVKPLDSCTINKINFVFDKNSSEPKNEETLKEYITFNKGDTFQAKDLSNIIKETESTLFETGKFIYVHISVREESPQNIDLDVFVKGKNNNSLSNIEKTGILATVGTNNILVQDVYKKTFGSETANNNKLLSQGIDKKEYLLQKYNIRKKAVDELIYKEIITQIYDNSLFKIPEDDFGKNEREILQKQFQADRNKLITFLEKDGKTFAQWRTQCGNELIIGEVEKFLESLHIKIGNEDIEAFYCKDIDNYLEYSNNVKGDGNIFSRIPAFQPVKYTCIKTENGTTIYIPQIGSEKLFISKINISGNCITPDPVIRSNIWAFPDAELTQKAISQSLFDISKLNLFSEISANVQEDDNKRLVFYIRVQEKEKKTETKALIQMGINSNSIGPAEFLECKQIERVALKEGYSTISQWAFALCTNISSVSIPATCSRVENGAFFRCRSLKEIKIPDSEISIEGCAFSMTAVRNAFVPKTSHNPLTIYEGCFSIEEFVVSSENRWFVAESGVLFTKDFKKLVRYPPQKADKKYVIPEKCLTIGENAFQKVSNLISLVIPETVKNIEGGAFSDFFYQMKENSISNSFSSVKTNIKIEMPVGLKDQLKENFSPEQVIFQTATNPQQNP